MKHLYFRVPTVESAAAIVKELYSQGITDNQIHLLGKDHYHLQMAHLREAGILQTTDLLHSLIRGILVGAIAGLAAGFLVFFFPPGGLVTGIWAITALTLLGALFGAWGSSLIGISVPNPIVHQCEEAIRVGELILFLDIPAVREEEIKSLIKKHHPEALIETLKSKK